MHTCSKAIPNIDWPGALYARGVVNDRLGDYQSAREDLDKFISTNADADQVPEAVYLSAQCSIELKEPDQAIASLNMLITKFEDSRRIERALYDLAWILKDSGRDAEAIEKFKVLTDKYPDGTLAAEALYHIAEQAYAAGDYDAAESLYVKVESHPQSPANGEIAEKSLYKHGWCLFQRNEFEKARQQFAKQMETYPKGPLRQDAQFMVGECHYGVAEYAEALDAYRGLAVEDIRSEIRPLLYLHGGQSAAQLKRWEESLKWLQIVVEKYSESDYIAQARYEIGWAYHQTGRTDDAIKQYREVADQFQNAIGARARFMLGEILFEQKQYAVAVQEFQRVMYGYGGNDAPEPLHVWQAKSGFEAGQCASALAKLSRDPDTRRRWLGEAVKAFQYVVQNHPRSDEAPRANERIQKLGA